MGEEGIKVSEVQRFYPPHPSGTPPRRGIYCSLFTGSRLKMFKYGFVTDIWGDVLDGFADGED
jgi:hypothetical protein